MNNDERARKSHVESRWHGAINAFNVGRLDGEWRHWMYEAKTASQEQPRLARLFAAERERRLPVIHQQCSMSQPEPVSDNHLTCCLGVECRKCPELLALEAATDITPEELDGIKAWTCVGHILSSGGDKANEGYVLTEDTKMFWSNVYENLSNGPGDES